MLTITIFAAGLVCLAGVLGLRLGRAQAQVSTVAAQARADERGITLQTLIVTAVLVLMAVAAGVVIVAITNNAAEDLEQTATNIESICEPVEIYNAVLAARGAEGENGGKEGSAAGCIPVCVWTADVDDDASVGADEIGFSRSLGAVDNVDAVGDVEDEDEFLFATSTAFYAQADSSTSTDLLNDGSAFEFATGIAGVKVATDQRSCYAHNDAGEEL